MNRAIIISHEKLLEALYVPPEEYDGGIRRVLVCPYDGEQHHIAVSQRDSGPEISGTKIPVKHGLAQEAFDLRHLHGAGCAQWTEFVISAEGEAFLQRKAQEAFAA